MMNDECDTAFLVYGTNYQHYYYVIVTAMNKVGSHKNALSSGAEECAKGKLTRGPRFRAASHEACLALHRI